MIPFLSPVYSSILSLVTEDVERTIIIVSVIEQSKKKSF